jgi:hypothetical protein
MTAIFTVITFFFIFVLVFLAISIALTMVGWWMARRAAKGKTKESIAAIEGKVDRLKDKAFVISIVLTFFFVTPFVVIYLFWMGTG